MQINSYFSSLVTIDEVSSYIPFASTVTNLADLFQKYVIFPLLNKEFVAKSHYYRYLDQKSAIRCVILLVPFVGNIVIGVYDFINMKKGRRLFDLALCYEEGKGVPQSKLQAAKLYRQAVDRGNVNAMYNLAYFYEEGCGVSLSYIQAAKLYRQAADRGHTNAMNDLGALYEMGSGVQKDLVEAKKLYQQAVDRGNVTARANLIRFKDIMASG